jgi:hypothetical protein
MKQFLDSHDPSLSVVMILQMGKLKKLLGMEEKYRYNCL